MNPIGPTGKIGHRRECATPPGELEGRIKDLLPQADVGPALWRPNVVQVQVTLVLEVDRRTGEANKEVRQLGEILAVTAQAAIVAMMENARRLNPLSR